ncbi:MAG: 3-phosphoshikimate 1-carboxyvinyltransferase [Treponema sp.]|nr:3-phosphoshikimate 1-carboxyvinyltransferase [Treponema sp.]
MDIITKHSSLSGHIQVPGSKSHTIRALLLASLAEGESHIYNPLPSADCRSTAAAIPLLGASVDFGTAAGNCWTVQGAGQSFHLPDDVVTVGNSGSLLYFLSPLAATLEGWSVFTGDESIRRRPVDHVVDALRQLGAEAHTAHPGSSTCPLIIRGPVKKPYRLTTAGSVSSQYISGLMMAALRLDAPVELELTDPKETPYLTMTQRWLEKVGAEVHISADYRHISVKGAGLFSGFDATVPSDWEAVAFPLVAALLTDSEITIDNVDFSGIQGDDAIVPILRSLGADIEEDREKATLTARGGKKARNGNGRLSTEACPGGQLHVNLSGFPDAICALAVVAAFAEGDTYIEDIAVCRRKETDRIEVLQKELGKLGVAIEAGPDFMIVHGHSPLLADGAANPSFRIHGGEVESYADHRVAMSLACLGLALSDNEQVRVKGAECCSVSFPRFYPVMEAIGADFKEAQ